MAIILSAVFLLGGLPGPRFITGGGGGIDIDSSGTDHDGESSDKYPVGDALEDDDNREKFSSLSSPSFCPFFFFVVKVVGLSSVYIVVGVRCLFGRLLL